MRKIVFNGDLPQLVMDLERGGLHINNAERLIADYKDVLVDMIAKHIESIRNRMFDAACNGRVIIWKNIIQFTENGKTWNSTSRIELDYLESVLADVQQGRINSSNAPTIIKIMAISTPNLEKVKSEYSWEQFVNSVAGFIMS